MPTSILSGQRRAQESGVVLLLLAVLAEALALTGCVELRPRGERADGSMDLTDDGTTPIDNGMTPTDAAQDATVMGCDQSGSCECLPTVTTTGLRVVAHGARLTASGGCFSDVTAVRIGGVEQVFEVEDDRRITIASVADGTPVGLSQPFVVASPVGESGTQTVAVTHLVVNEVDARTNSSGPQRRQFVEIDTGLNAFVDLSEYMVVFFDGAADAVYGTTGGVALGRTAANGLYLISNPQVLEAQASLPNGTLAPTTTPINAHAVVIYQGTQVPREATLIGSITLPMVDAIVYSTVPAASDTGLLDVCYPEAADRVQNDEAANGGNPVDQSIRRCAAPRRAGPSFRVGPPTPGAAHACP